MRSGSASTGLLALLLLSARVAAQPALPPETAAPVDPASEASPPAATEPAPTSVAPAPPDRPEPTSAASSAPGSLPENSADDSLALDPAAAGVMIGEDTPKLELYGFADFSYVQVFTKKENILRHYVAPYPSFYVGHLNLYLSSTLGENWRSLAEVRFTYSPLGDDNTAAADGSFPAPDTTAVDYAELQRNFSWGGIEIQRVWIEYQPFDFLSIRGGQWFSPYGYWNDDHGSPTIIGVHKPFPISEGIFPEKQTGLIVHGKYFIDSTAIGYALTLSNGRGPYDAIRDLDNNKAVGGRLYLDTTAIGNLTIGVDAYRGMYTASTKRYRVDTSTGSPVAEIYRTVDSRYDELSYGVDLRWLWKGVHLQAELMCNEAAFEDKNRPATIGFNPRPTFAADYRRLGTYALLGYRIEPINLMPYAMIEHSTFTSSDLAPPIVVYTGGLNLRPTPNVVLKAELAYADFDGTGSTGLGQDNMAYFGTQAAWAF